MLFLLGFVSVLMATPLDQDTHRRLIASDNIRGSYLMVTHIQSFDQIRFDLCGVDSEKSCRSLARPLSKREADEAHTRLVRSLKEYRQEIAAEKPQGFLKALVIPGNEADLKALDLLIDDLEKSGLSGMGLLTTENIQKDPPDFYRRRVADEVYRRIEEALKLVPARPQGPRIKNPPRTSCETEAPISELTEQLQSAFERL